jgi:hypothetical protein
MVMLTVGWVITPRGEHKFRRWNTMIKKTWEKPEINELNVERTEYGNSVTPKIDATYSDGDSTFYSFS